MDAYYELKFQRDKMNLGTLVFETRNPQTMDPMRCLP